MAVISTSKSLTFFYLSGFSATGGIEKFNRCFIKALAEIAEQLEWKIAIISVYDQKCDERYCLKKNFQGFAKKRLAALKAFVIAGLKQEVVVIGHINLAVAGLLVKLLRPRCKLVVIAHGIESWRKLKGIPKWCLLKADLILAVSNYTKNQLILRSGIKGEKIKLFPNTLDPFFRLTCGFSKPEYLLRRYRLMTAQPVIYTLSRLSTSERHKGYDNVIEALPEVLRSYPDAVYILAGKFDTVEQERITRLIRVLQLERKVILPGFIDNKEIEDHYRLADVFILPSRKEGFGIVFLEAMACGTPTIGGNQDGTVDALLNGSLGQLINPTKQSEIAAAICRQLSGEIFNNPANLQQSVSSNFRFTFYWKRLEKVLTDLMYTS